MEINIDSLIKERISEIDIEEIAREIVVSLIKDDTKKLINKIVGENLDFLIKSEINRSMSMQVVTDDGWGKKEVFNTFEDLFKSTLQKKLNDTYKIKNVIASLVKERVDALIKKDYDTVVESIVDTITNSRLVKKS